MSELVPANTERWATVVYFHGGGLTAGSPELLAGSCLLFAREAGVPLLSVRSRLALEHIFPANVFWTTGAVPQARAAVVSCAHWVRQRRQASAIGREREGEQQWGP